MINFDLVLKENIKESTTTWPHIPNHPSKNINNWRLRIQKHCVTNQILIKFAKDVKDMLKIPMKQNINC